jgi:hypothetical protein
MDDCASSIWGASRLVGTRLPSPAARRGHDVAGQAACVCPLTFNGAAGERTHLACCSRHLAGNLRIGNGGHGRGLGVQSPVGRSFGRAALAAGESRRVGTLPSTKCADARRSGVWMRSVLDRLSITLRVPSAGCRRRHARMRAVPKLLLAATPQCIGERSRLDCCSRRLAGDMAWLAKRHVCVP